MLPVFQKRLWTRNGPGDRRRLRNIQRLRDCDQMQVVNTMSPNIDAFSSWRGIFLCYNINMTLNLKKFLVFLFLIFSFFPFSRIFAVETNAGFVHGNIWYSKDPFYEGDKIKIYTVIFNPDERALSGTVTFFDQTTFLDKKNFTVPAKGTGDISVDWTATIGSHTIFGKIENAKFLISKDKYETAYLSDDETEKSSRTVSKKIETESNNTDSTNNSSIDNIRNTIIDNTPEFIAKPIESATGAIESVRTNLATSSENKKTEVKTEIDKLNSNSGSTTSNSVKNSTKDNVKIKAIDKNNISVDIKNTDTGNKIMKPLKYVELFFLQLAAFVFGNKFLFYTLGAVIILLIIRFVFRKIF